MHFYNSDPSADKLMALRSSVDQVRNIMVENIDKVLQRGEKVELLVKKTEVMSEQAVSMRKRATALKRRMWVNNVKMYFICAVLILLGILTLSISVCGVTFDNC
jgi:vesicle-associated membrane protein 7